MTLKYSLEVAGFEVEHLYLLIDVFQYSVMPLLLGKLQFFSKLFLFCQNLVNAAKSCTP
jgi:hypothetical protein